MYGLKMDWGEAPASCSYTLDDYEGAVARWCPGCGDHAVLTAVQRLCRDQQLPPHETVVVSGIGCSSRFPYYMASYGFHGLHGRALPIAQGVRSRRPDLNVFVVTGDGDCTSIGAGHWIHAIRYNMKMVVMLFDNNVYGLTKNQTSPTSSKGQSTNTHPRGAWLEPLNPLQVTLGITNVSFVAQTVDWHPVHLQATLSAAHQHPGLSFVRIIQRCPHYTEDVFEPYRSDPSRVLLLHHADGTPLPEQAVTSFPNRHEHDPSDLSAARDLASGTDPLPIGIFYRNPGADRYDQFTVDGMATSRADKLAAVRRQLDNYRV